MFVGLALRRIGRDFRGIIGPQHLASREFEKTSRIGGSNRRAAGIVYLDQSHLAFLANAEFEEMRRRGIRRACLHEDVAVREKCSWSVVAKKLNAIDHGKAGSGTPLAGGCSIEIVVTSRRIGAELNNRSVRPQDRRSDLKT